MNQQRLFSIARQVLAVAAAIAASVPQDSLPVAIRASFVLYASLILGIEHYVADPSTGTTPPVEPQPVPNGHIGPTP